MHRGGRCLVWIAVTIAAGAALVFFSYSRIIESVAGSTHLSTQTQPLSAGARKLIDQAFDGIEPGSLKDYHVHIIGMSQESTGSWVDPGLLSWWGLHKKIKGDVFIRASGVSDLRRFDQHYVDRLVSLIKSMPVRGKYQLLAFDYYHTQDGMRSIDKSELYVPNQYVFQLTRQYPELFTAAVSIHPYRQDAVKMLAYWAGQGVRFVKWLPNAQGIRPDDPRLAEFYDALVAHKMVLLTHVGVEYAISSSRHDQSFGDPQRLISALDKGVKIIMAHAASAGRSVDLTGNGLTDNFELFLRLMRAAQYKNNLFGDISALTQFNRLPGPLARLLEQSDVHHRLVNGSDYPLPAINMAISTRLLAYHGFITDSEQHMLNEIYQVNPLLFDFVSKRTVRHPVSGKRFPPQVFMVNTHLDSISG